MVLVATFRLPPQIVFASTIALEGPQRRGPVCEVETLLINIVRTNGNTLDRHIGLARARARDCAATTRCIR